MSLRTRLFIIITLIVLIILGISLVLVVRGRKSITLANPPAGGIPVTGQPDVIEPSAAGQTSSAVIPPAVPIPPMTSVEAEQNGVRLFAKIFIERFQSYSTDANFQNIKEVEAMVAPTLWKRLSSKILAAPSSGPFVGVTTEAVVSTLIDWKPPTAVVNVKTRATMEKNNVVTRNFPEYTVTLVKVGGNWLVESFSVQQ